MVVKAVLTAAAIRATVKVFAEALELDTDPSWHTAAGVDFGTALVTKDGARGDRELLFLGTPANQAAKILSKGLRISATVRDLLPESFSSWITTTSDPGVYAIAINADHLEDLVKAHGYSWSRQRSRERLQKALESYPPGSATVHTVTGAIDKDVLGMSNTKRVNAVSIFADVDGFTSYIARADMLGTLPEAVRAYHAIRYEMRQTIVSDYDGLRVQYQGDRIQGLAYLPISDEQAAAVGAVKVAAALHSAVAEVLPQVIGAEAAKPLAIGLAAGAVMVSKLGEHGNRDVVSLGLSTADAARIQERLPGWHTGIDTSLHNRLPAWLAELFKWDAAARAYVASDLKLDEVERAEAQAGMEPATSSARASTRRASALVGVAEPLRPYLMRD